jgi:uncharacterized RDD family membrane protein YckC
MTDQYPSQWPDASLPNAPASYSQQPVAVGYPPQPGDPVSAQRDAYASWRTRVHARLIDQFPMYVGFIICSVGYVVLIMQVALSSGPIPQLEAAVVVMIIGFSLVLASLGWTAYNRWIIGGRTGQSVGKRSTKIRLIGEETHAPIGARNAFIRDLVHILDALTVVGYLWPKWDDRKQTLADQIMKTIVINETADTLGS